MAKIRLQLIHYGAPFYKKELFKSISDIPYINKPKGGLWTTPVNSEYGWKHWCSDEDYGDLSKSFEIEFYGEILKIDNVKDLDKLCWIDIDPISFVSFQALCIPMFIYDAIHLTIKGKEETRFSNPRSLYGWDCETVFIMNPSAIINNKSNG